MISPRSLLFLGFVLVIGCSSEPDDPSSVAAVDTTESFIQPYEENPHYLAWGNTPIFPLGAAGYHSWTPISRPGTMDFEAQLDRLGAVMKAIDSPHVRGFVRALPYDPMNHMHDGEVQRVLQPWVRTDDGRYDLEEFAPEWEERLSAFLDASLKREIVVSLEVWDDWSVTRGPGGQYDPGEGAAWNAHPFNPANNVNYSAEVLPETTAVCNAPFYSTIPARENIQRALQLQKLYVDRLLDIAADYPHVLINLSNESRAHVDWSHYWAEYARERLPDRMMIGEMPSTTRETDEGQCDPALSPEAIARDTLYDYVDVAQAVSGHSFQEFSEQALGGGRRINDYRAAMTASSTRKPVVVSKDYGRTPDGGEQVLWSRFFGGAAAARFHRLGREHGQEVIDFQHAAVERLGQFLAEIPFWRMQPAPELITELPSTVGANILSDGQARVTAQVIGETGGTLTLDLPGGNWTVAWIDPNTSQSIDRFERRSETSGLTLSIPENVSHRILLVERIDA